jgi:hypothetical protein
MKPVLSLGKRLGVGGSRATGIGGGERGATVVIVAILVVVMFGFTALAVDVARLYAERRELQRTADVSALSAAQALIQSGSAAVARGRQYIELNPTTHHRKLAAGDRVSPLFGSSGCDPEGSVAYDCVRVSLRTPAKNEDPEGFEYVFAPVLGIDPNRSVSAEATAVLGAAVPGGEKLVPWAVLDCPDPATYPDEGGEVPVLAATVNPSCQGGDYPVSESYSGARISLFLDNDEATGGNFGAIGLAGEPGCPHPEGLFPHGGGASDYSAFLAGEGSSVVPCPLDIGARVFPKPGQMSGPTTQGLASRGVGSSNCTSQSRFNADVDPGIAGDGFVSIRRVNPCMMILAMVVHANPQGSGGSAPGGCCISQWQHPDPLDIEKGRFSRPQNGASRPMIVRDVGLFYLVSPPGSSTYQGIFLRALDSGESDLGPRSCERDTSICVVKLVD